MEADDVELDGGREDGVVLEAGEVLHLRHREPETSSP